jgi:anti-sigma regulatory factor (Ser/Thr protein kinase)
MTPKSSAGKRSKSSLDYNQESRIFVARYDSLDAIREFVGQVAKACTFDVKSIYAIELATDEAFTNIVEHAYGGESSQMVECTCQIRDSGLTIILHDCGQAFDPTLVPEPNLDAPLEERETGGLGIYFMKKLMDEVHFSPASKAADGCNTLTMLKRKERPA